MLYQRKGFEKHIMVPFVIHAEKALLVVHFDFVNMSNNIGRLTFNHLVHLVKISANRFTGITTENILQTFIIGFSSGAVNKPQFLFSKGNQQMHTANHIVKIGSFLPIPKILKQTGDVINFH